MCMAAQCTHMQCSLLRLCSSTNVICIYTLWSLHQWHTAFMHVASQLQPCSSSLHSLPHCRMLLSVMDSWFSTSSSLLSRVWSSCFSLPSDASRAALWTAITTAHVCTHICNHHYQYNHIGLITCTPRTNALSVCFTEYRLYIHVQNS